MPGMKVYNNYAHSVPFHGEAPKTVMTAIAYSFALRLAEDDHERALAIMAEEWRLLYENGIVPQKPGVKAKAAEAASPDPDQI